MSQPLPPRANLEWLKKLCKERLAELRAHDPDAKLSQAQLAVARQHGFPSWRKLKAHVEQLRAPATPSPSSSSMAAVPPDDEELAQLFAAVRAGDVSGAAELLARRPALAAAHGPGGQAPLHLAAQFDDPRLAVLLTAHGADPEAKFGQSGHSALSWAAVCNSQAFAQALVRLGHTPDLYCAAGIGALEHVQAYFGESGALAPGAAQTGSSRFAADGSRLPCPPQTPGEQISDALCMACRNAHADVVCYLLTRRPDLSFRGFLGGTPLHWAYFGGSRSIIDMLEQAGADRSARDEVYHCTPRTFGICVAASWGFPHLVRARLEEDPALARVTDGGSSPLHEAARGGNAEVVRLLLEGGADPAHKDAKGKTPLDIAQGRKHMDAVDLLARAVAGSR
jgi:ankyrin repeat protein